jgi:hypothetical protein
MGLHNVPLKDLIFLMWPFGLYSGWISVALIANVAAYLTKIGWNGFGISETAWTIVMFAVAALVHIFMIWAYDMRAFALAALWALIAIAVANQNTDGAVFWGAIITTIIIFINIAFHGFRKRKSPLRAQHIYN